MSSLHICGFHPTRQTRWLGRERVNPQQDRGSGNSAAFRELLFPFLKLFGQDEVKRKGRRGDGGGEAAAFGRVGS